MIERGGIAPYAGTDGVMSVIHAYRDRPIPTPIDVGVIERIGGSAEASAARVQQALRLLDLLDAEGNPTAAMEGLRKAGRDEFPERLAEVVRAAYGEVFTYRDPATEDIGKIEDAFREYQPVSMRPRMVRLFMGLCRAARIIETAGRVSDPNARPKKNGGARAKAPTRAEAVSEPVASPRNPPSEPSMSTPSEAPAPTVTPMVGIQGSDHLVIRGLLQTLPEVGTVWPDAARKEWTDAVMAAFNLIYKRPTSDSIPTSRTSVLSKEA
jgi:hypothetical protein